MNVIQLIRSVQAKLDDPDGTYITPDYVLSFVEDTYEELANSLRLTDSDFDERVLELPGVQAGLPDLSSYAQPGKPLEELLTPRMLEWKLPGQGANFYRAAAGPLDKLPDVPDPGIPQITAWTFLGRVIQITKTSTALDLRITGDFLPDPLVSGDDQSQLPVNANAPFKTKVALAIAKARGMDKLMKSLSDDLTDQLDDVEVALTKMQQSGSRRLGRLNRRQGMGGASEGIIPH
jgi:hypothetical protein